MYLIFGIIVRFVSYQMFKKIFIDKENILINDLTQLQDLFTFTTKNDTNMKEMQHGFSPIIDNLQRIGSIKLDKDYTISNIKESYIINTKDKKLGLEFGKVKFINNDSDSTDFFVINNRNNQINKDFDISKLNNQLIFGASQIKGKE